MTSKISSIVPMPPGRAMKASERSSMIVLRSAIVSMRISSVQCSKRMPGVLKKYGTTPMIFPPIS